MSNRKKTILIIILFNLLILVPIFLDTVKIGHDLTFHLSNIDILSKNMSWESIINGFNIRPDIANNLGYGIGIFYPMLPHLICAITYNFLSIFGLNIISSIYVLYFIISVISSILIYNLSIKLHKNNVIALLSSLIYLTMPYFIANMFVRFAISEVFFFMFFLIMINGLFYYNKESIKKFYLLFILGYTGMILSHLVLSLFASIFFIIFCLINIKTIKNYFKPLLIGILTVSIIVLPNIMLLLQHQLSNIYIFNQPNVMTSSELVTASTLGINNFIIPQKGYYQYVPCYIPIIIIIFMIISLIYILINNKKFNDKKIIFIIMVFGISFFMILKIFPWFLLPDFLLMIQFPWRLEGLMIIGVAILSPLFLLYFKDKKYFKKLVITTITVLVLVNMVLVVDINTIEYKYIGYETNDAMGHQKEYLPYDTISNWDSITMNIATDDVLVNTSIINNKENFEFEISNVKRKTNIVLPRLYYYGYKLKCSHNHIHNLKNSNGYISLNINHDGIYKLKYTGTNVYIITRIARIIFLTTIIIYLVTRCFKKYKI